MKESEARKKWCPFARGIFFDSNSNRMVTHNRTEYGKAPEDCLCIGNDCIAWRELRDQGEVYGGYCGLVPS